MESMSVMDLVMNRRLRTGVLVMRAGQDERVVRMFLDLLMGIVNLYTQSHG